MQNSVNGHRRQLLKLGFLSLLHAPIAKLLAQAPKIAKRAIPSTKELLPVIGLGTWRVFNVNPSGGAASGRKQVLQTLIKESPGSMVDSSPMYGYSEDCVGVLAENLGQRTAFFFASKVWTTGKTEGINQIKETFEKFRTQKMDLMQVHNLVDVQTQLRTLFDLKEQGKIRYVGITHYLPGSYPELARIIKNQKIDFVQCCYNVRVRDAETELLPLARDKGVAVIINRPFEEGQLFNLVKDKSLPPWARDYQIGSWAQYFLKYILSNDAVTCIIPGTSQATHLFENIRAGSGSLPDEKGRKKMIDHFDKL